MYLKAKTREEWLKERGGKIGGSDLPAIMGLSKYRSPYDVWLRKTNREPPLEENETLLSGRFLEAAIADWFDYESDHVIIKSSKGDILYTHPDYPFLVGSPDRRFFINGFRGEKGVLEIKTTRMKVDPDDLPKSWFIQPLYYTGMLGYKKFIICWYDRISNHMDWREFDFDQEIYDIIIKEVVDFWNNHILTDIPPQPRTASDVAKLFPDHREGKSVEATEEVLDLYAKAIEVKRNTAILKKDYSVLTEQIKLVMRDSEYLLSPDGSTLATFRTGKRGRTLLIKEI